MVKDFSDDDSAWADFLIAKAALILASVVLFAAFFQLAAGFKDLEARDRLDFLARDFKAAVDEVGAGNFPAGTARASYCFGENEAFLASPFRGGLDVHVSGEYVRLRAEADGRNITAVRPFAFRVLPFNESVLREKLLSRFGAEGSEKFPVPVAYPEIEAFLQSLGAEEAVLDAGENISIQKEFVYVKEGEEVSAFAFVLVYQ